MARRPRKLHELVPIERSGKAYVWRTKWIYLGKWDEDGPSSEAVVRLAQLKELWAVDPGAKAKEPPRPPIPDRVVDFNAMPTPRRLSTYRGG